MAHGFKSGGRDFTAGDPRAGRPSLPPEVREAKRIQFVEMQNILIRLLDMTHSQISELVENPHSTMKELLLASIMNKALIEGDPVRLSWIMMAIFGKGTLERVKADLRYEVDDPAMLREIPSSVIIDLIRKNKEPKGGSA